MLIHTACVNILDLFQKSIVFQGLERSQYPEIIRHTRLKEFEKDEYIFHSNEPCNYFYIVLKGLVKTSVCSLYGTKITYLLAEQGEPINLIGPFNGKPRFIQAKAIKKSYIGYIPRNEFVDFALNHPLVIVNIISILGTAIDSANTRVIDMIEKNVDQRLYKTLHTLYKKFGARLMFTSQELADLSGTTVESTLRAIGKLKALGVIDSSRGKIEILSPTELKKFGEDTLWV